LAKNCLEGDLSASISKLSAVESLELQDNKLSSLPASLGECTSLRVLNVSKNALKVFPVEHLNSCPIQDLDVSNNKISGVFFPSSVERWDSLQSLNIKMNRVTAFSESSITLPALDQLFLSNNLMIDFPAVGHCDQLLVLLVDDNHISMLSTEIYNLRQLRTLDFSSNDIKVIDPRLGGMDSLQVINFAGNPLLDRKLAGMSTANLKKVLKGRLAPPEIVIAAAEDDEDDIENMGLTYSDTVVEKALEVGRAGLLDLSNKAYSELSSELMGSVIGSPVTMLLSHNSLTSFPTSLDIFASLSSLDMSFNKLSSDYLPEKLVLRSLETLNLHSTTIISLEQLFKSLDAPKLQTLDISANRVTSIAGVRQAFPVLMNLHASDNQIEEIPLESVDGIRVLDLSGNSISVLPPRLALSSNLRELKVHGNTFRVPRWQVLDKGTQAVLSWLKDRLPADEAEAEQFD
jgi:Leucine-rich repeat (LRR) protein